ncbi:right-handed parallel beta-helix repeat-containing protein [Conservatibacter flavescens]|uniref:Uncharacterized protein n=1 Tax=Conservatibacter flavescens TaxID=28161 RepID=A0A2M8S507_9PAST|nr:right-handed parallel beta-helix repeat-containing protein [Conservatibacter flavescens]PJG86225.1 hypothetical protein CVP05_03375 [Conservatibacter flavescens]
MRNKINRIDSGNGKFKDGNPLTGEYGTIVKAEWLNAVQEGLLTNQGEILTVLRKAGIDPNEADETQLWQALQVISGQVESIEALRKFEPLRDNQAVFVKGYYAGSNVGGGYFIANLKDTTTADNGGTVIVTARGKRWVRVSNHEIKLSEFGLKGGKANAQEDTIKINAAFKYAYEKKIPNVTNDIPNDYYLSTFIRIGDNLTFTNVDGVRYLRATNGAMLYNGLTITPESSAENRCKNIKIIGGVFDSNATEFWSSVNFMSLGYIDGLHIDGVKFINCVRNHAIDMSACTNVLIENCRFLGFSPEVTTKYGTAPGLTHDRSYAEAIQIDDNVEGTFSGGRLKGDSDTNIIIRNNIFGKNPDDTTGLFGGYGCAVGAHYAARGVAHHANIIIEGNLIEDCLYAGIRPFVWDDVKIINNVFRRNRRHIYIWWLADTGVNPSEAGKNYHIEGNDFGDVVAEHITLQIFGNNYTDGFAKTEDVIIAGNTFGRTEWKGPLIKLQGAHNAVVTNNVFDVATRFIDINYCSNISVTNNYGNKLEYELLASRNDIYPPNVGISEDIIISGNMAKGSSGGVLYLSKMRNVNVINNIFLNVANKNSISSIRALDTEGLFIDNNIVTLAQSAVEVNTKVIDVADTCTNVNVGGLLTNSSQAYRVRAVDFEGVKFDLTYIRKSQIEALIVGVNDKYRNLLVNGSALITKGLTVGTKDEISFASKGYAQAQSPPEGDNSIKLATTEWVKNLTSKEKVLWHGSSTNAVSINLNQQTGLIYILYSMRGFNKFDSFLLGDAHGTTIGHLEYGGENADRAYNSLIRLTVNNNTLTLTPEGHHIPTIKKVILIGA